MSYYPDLGQRTMVVSGPDIRAIGWLAAEHPFPTGPVSRTFRDRLEPHVAAAMSSLYLGVHGCEFRPDDADGFAADKRELAVPSGPVLYVAPAMIGHSVRARFASGSARSRAATAGAVRRCLPLTR